MKIQRTATLILTILLILLIAVFSIFGNAMRDYYSAKVTYTRLIGREISGQSYAFTVPRKSVHYDEDGTSYIFAIKNDDSTGEKRTAVYRYDVGVLSESDLYSAVRFQSEELYDLQIAVDSDREISDNQRVIVTGRAETEENRQ